jgi:phosphoserine aminotransferase
MERVYNFSAGPSMMPESVLETARDEMLSYAGSGMSVMEMSHRSKDYEAIIAKTEEDMRSLMGIPDNYKVLFLQGGASTQFAMVPLNLMKTGKADYVVTGSFAKKAAEEARKYGKVNVVASSADKNFTYIPKMTSDMFSDDADYIHTTTNNTIYGTTIRNFPQTKATLVTDMSSCILSEPVDVTRYGLIYAGAQKNIGPAGLTVVIIREDLLGNAMEITPTMLNYEIHAKNDSMYNTPPAYSIYVCGLIMKWLISIGGVKEIERRNKEKAALLYDYLDQSKLFRATVPAKEDRSMMNVTFVTGDADLDAKFVTVAKENGLVSIKGHRSVGGMRASIYNAMPVEGVKKLVSVMEQFEKDNK